MENYTYNSLTLQLEGLNVSKEYLYPVFLFLFFSYLFIIVTNVSIAVLIFIDKNLHQPMYLLFCNLPFNDILGNSILVPRLLMDMLKPPSERLIGYHECVLQAFTSHMFGTTSHTVLMIGLTMRLNRCRTMIESPYCDNAGLFKLSCDNVFINNVYGLTFTVVLFTASIGTMVITYTKITVVCLTSNSKSLNSKALKTCSTHLVLFLIMIFSGMSIITLHRFPQYTNYRKFTSILFHIVPGSLNPIIYGVQSKEIRMFLANSFKSKKVWPLC
ncbi:olfactory receptor 1L3-like [Trematomus bernacchii]|uniref:olfactory receptor 1L3-like n=1 Tax=Trematomus bernacchii TaxID=40690 RepID=UPI00146B0BCA|nr:olfactory receptor 1L3-like [Trematomus bernacchii]